MEIKHNFYPNSNTSSSAFKIPLPKHVLSSSPSSRPSGQRQKIFFNVNRQMCEQFPLLLAHSPASSQLRPSGESFVLGKFSQEHSKLPQVLRQTSWHSPRPLFLEHSFSSVYLWDFQWDDEKASFINCREKRDENCSKRRREKLVSFPGTFFLFLMNMN